MNMLRAIWNELAVFFGFHVPAEVSPDMPQSLEEYRERKRINEQQSQRQTGGSEK